MSTLTTLVLLILALVQSPRTPQDAVEELLAADRQFSYAGAGANAATAISAMFADDVAMPTPPDGFARGKKAVEAFLGTPAMATSRAEWTPIRGGISADGQHGFTFGYMTLHRPDGTREALKYLSYWIRQQEGWRVVVFKRNRSVEATGPHDMMAPALPERLVTPTTDPAAVAKHRESLEAAERAFSDEAQKIGLGPAFAQFGSDDAVNMGPPGGSRFVVGAAAIGRTIGAGLPLSTSPVAWAPEQVIVASSGDLGVTVGFLRRNAPLKAGQSPTIPFITVWRRPRVSAPWRYVAE